MLVFLENATSLQTTMSDCMKKIEELKKEMDAKDKEVDKLKKQVENINRLEQDKSKLLKEVCTLILLILLGLYSPMNNRTKSC